MTPEVLISVRGASKKFCSNLKLSLRYAIADVLSDLVLRRRDNSTLRRGEFWALRDVSFDLQRGESVAVMGVNGAGKSTLIKLILGTLRLNEGRIETAGRLAALSELGLGFDPILTGRENAYMSAAVLDIDRRRIDESFDDIVEFADLGDFIESPVQIYSSGMRARLGFATAMYLEPDVLLVDEVLTTGDIGFQRRCIAHAKRYLTGGGSLFLVSHNPHLVQSICSRCIVIDHGSAIFDGDVVEGVSRYFELAKADATDPIARDPTVLAVPPTSLVTGEMMNAAGSSGGRIDPSEASGVVIEEFGIEPVGRDRICSGEAVKISVRYHSHADLKAWWGFSLHTADLETTITSDWTSEPFSLSSGHGGLACTIPRLPLSGGRYALRVALMDADTQLPFAMGGIYDAPRYFEVGMPASLRNNRRLQTKELIALEDVTWDELTHVKCR